MKGYDLMENGFTIKLDMKLYDREAVMKALYRFHDRYIISYEASNGFIRVYFETSKTIESIDREVAEVMKELSFQMIRCDTVRRTKGIRELLVARSLYATCIEPEREAVNNSEEASDWQADEKRLFASWSAE